MQAPEGWLRGTWESHLELEKHMLQTFKGQGGGAFADIGGLLKYWRLVAGWPPEAGIMPGADTA